MPSLTPNIENRVRKLPKPSNHTQGLLPLFEAVSNAFYAIEDRFKDAGTVGQGKVDIQISQLSDATAVEIIVTDNGIGLDKDRYQAFCEIDTDFKRAKGGKGVGRLFWLDAFSRITVDSVYLNDTEMDSRSFAFLLNNDEQITPVEKSLTAFPGTGTCITFSGIRSQEYATHFPKKSDTFLRYFSAHFISDFLLGSSPDVSVTINGETTNYPYEISDLVIGGALETGEFQHPDFGEMSITGFTCKPEASTGLEGRHQLHFLADGRTVESRKIDNLLGLESLIVGEHSDLVFHGCVSGKFLDARVNEGRSAFTFPERTLKAISRHCVSLIKERLFPDQIAKYELQRRKNFQSFVSRHPIYGFDDQDIQLNRVPFHAREPEEFATGLVKYQIRQEEGRQVAIQDVINSLDGGAIPADFQELVEKVTNDIQVSERLALAQHVVRRKLVLELFEKLLRRIRERDGKPDDNHLERTLHSFICPMGVRGDDPSEIKARAHDLWIVDERLAFTRAFSSDKRLDQILADGGSAHRPDLMVWDLAYGLGVSEPELGAEHVDTSEPLTKMMVVEFKKPGRKIYAKPEDQVEQQITKYLAQLKGGEIETFQKTRVRIANDCVFYCYVVADIVGDLELQLSAWPKTANGSGRLRNLEGAYRGSIEVIQWQDLVNDAWARNKATLHAAGLSRSESSTK